MTNLSVSEHSLIVVHNFKDIFSHFYHLILLDVLVSSQMRCCGSVAVMVLCQLFVIIFNLQYYCCPLE